MADEAQANSIKGELDGGLDFMEAAMKCAPPLSHASPMARTRSRRCHCPPRSVPLPSPLDVAGSDRTWSQGLPHPVRLAAALRAWRQAKRPCTHAPRRAGTQAATQPRAAATSVSSRRDRWSRSSTTSSSASRTRAGSTSRTTPTSTRVSAAACIGMGMYRHA